jgi:ParB family chromosome partitioning protein
VSSDQNQPNEIPISQIQKNPYQPRMIEEDDKLIELSNSIKINGVIQPILVRKLSGGYQLIAGERRLQASKMAGKTTIPCIVINIPEDKLLEYAIIENVQREDLNPIEEALAYNKLQTLFNLTQDEIAEKVGKNRSTITNSLRLLKLSQEIQDDIIAGRLSAGHARAILSLETPFLQKKLRDAIIKRNLSVRQAEEMAKNMEKNVSFVEKIKKLDPNIADIENKLLHKFGVKTKLNPKSKTSGKIEIFYNNLDEFEKIMQVLDIETE